MVVGVCGQGAYQNLEDPFNKGDPQILAPLCELLMGYIVPLPFHEGSVNSWKKHTHTVEKSPLLIKKNHPSLDTDNVGAGSWDRVDYHRWIFFLLFLLIKDFFLRCMCVFFQLFTLPL